MFKKIQQLQGGGAHPPSQHPQINLDSLTGSEDSQKEEQQAAQAGGVVPANLMGTPGSALLDGEPITPNIRPPSPTRVSAAAAEGGGTPAVAGGEQVAEGAKGGVSVGAPLSVRKAARGREKEGGGGSVLLRAEGQPLPAQELHGRDAGVGLLAEGEGARLVEEGMPLSSLGSLRPESTGEDLPPAASAATPTTDGDDVSGRSEVVRGKDGEKKRPGRGQTKQEGKRRKLAVLSRDLGERQVEGGVREDEEEVGPAYVGYFQKPLGKDRQEELKRKLGY